MYKVFRNRKTWAPMLLSIGTTIAASDSRIDLDNDSSPRLSVGRAHVPPKLDSNEKVAKLTTDYITQKFIELPRKLEDSIFFNSVINDLDKIPVADSILVALLERNSKKDSEFLSRNLGPSFLARPLTEQEDPFTEPLDPVEPRLEACLEDFGRDCLIGG